MALRHAAGPVGVAPAHGIGEKAPRRMCLQTRVGAARARTRRKGQRCPRHRLHQRVDERRQRRRGRG